MVTVSKEKLMDFVTKIFLHTGLSLEDAAQAAEVIVQSDVSGVGTHGLARLPMYAGRLIGKMVNKDPKVRQLNQSENQIALDADNGLGIVVVPRAMDLCMERAKRFGMAAVTVKNSNHYGVGNYYALKGISQDMIVMIMSNTTPIMAPTGGVERLIGTNPLTVGVPAGKELPVILDMATSATSHGKLEETAREGKQIPAGWALTKEGAPTEDPKAAMEGTILPIGGYKGYGLALVIDLLAPVLAGACFGADVGRLDIPNNPKPEGIGHFMLAVDISKFQPLEAFKESIDRYIASIRHSRKAEGVAEIYLPGEIELQKMKERTEKGIPVSDALAGSILQFAQRIGFARENDTFESMIG